MTACDSSDALPRIAAGLRDARITVLKRWEHRDAGGHSTGEEFLTNLLLDTAEPVVRYVEFNRRQEGVVGADWLWWFVEDDGTSFGLLVQAKKLNGAVGAWTVDLGYPDGTRRQMISLLQASDRLVVPAGYIIYFGRRERRPDVACSDEDTADCRRCERAGIAVLPALVANQIARSALPYHPGELVVDSYRQAAPLEDLGRREATTVFDPNLRACTPELRSFLTSEQRGARAVAKRIFRLVSDYRLGSLSVATAVARPTEATEAVFDELPDDRAHFGVSYFEHVLRGLRRRPPAYLTDVLSGAVTTERPPKLEGVAGLVLVQV